MKRRLTQAQPQYRLGVFVLALLIGLLGTALTTSFWRSAEAHSAQVRFSTTNSWDSDIRIRRAQIIDSSGLQTQAALDRFRQANNAINAISGSWMDINDSNVQDESVIYLGVCFTPPIVDRVWLGTESMGTAYAKNRRCTDGNTNYDLAYIRFDLTDRTWFTGTSQSVPSEQSSLWGITTHEYGHAIGWLGSQHLTSATNCPDNTAQHTMCATFSKSTTGYINTLNTHDIHTIANKY